MYHAYCISCVVCAILVYYYCGICLYFYFFAQAAHTRIGDWMIYYNMRVHNTIILLGQYNNGFVTCIFYLSIQLLHIQFASLSMSTNLLLPRPYIFSL